MQNSGGTAQKPDRRRRTALDGELTIFSFGTARSRLELAQDDAQLARSDGIGSLIREHLGHAAPAFCVPDRPVPTVGQELWRERPAQLFAGSDEPPVVARVNGAAGAALWLPPDVHPDEDALFTLLQESTLLLKPDAQPIGTMLPASWDRLQAVLIQGGFLERPLDLSTVYTTSYLAP